MKRTWDPTYNEPKPKTSWAIKCFWPCKDAVMYSKLTALRHHKGHDLRYVDEQGRERA